MKIHYFDIPIRKVNGQTPFSLGVVKPERHNLTLIVGGQSKSPSKIVKPNQSSTPQLPAA